MENVFLLKQLSDLYDAFVMTLICVLLCYILS